MGVSNDPISIIQEWQRTPVPTGWRVIPGLEQNAITAHVHKWTADGYTYPELMERLLRYSAGIESPGRRCSFDGDGPGDRPLAGSIPIMSDETGNYWTIDTAFDPSRLGPVFFVCHDPPVIVYQSHDLASFLDTLLKGQPVISTDGQIWSAGAAGGERDGDWIVFDLSNEIVGRGAPLNLYYDEPEGLERVGTSLVFRIRASERTAWQRLRDRWR